jgi:hypothetical protein
MLLLRSVLAVQTRHMTCGIDHDTLPVREFQRDVLSESRRSKGERNRGSVGPRGHAKIMKHATRVQTGTIFYMSNGKLYETHDRRMAGGQMLHDLLVQAL